MIDGHKRTQPRCDLYLAVSCRQVKRISNFFSIQFQTKEPPVGRKRLASLHGVQTSVNFERANRHFSIYTIQPNRAAEGREVCHGVGPGSGRQMKTTIEKAVPHLCGGFVVSEA